MSAEPSSDPRLIHLAPDDNICAAARMLEAGEIVAFRGRQLRIAQRVPTGHKVAVEPIAAGEPVRKYGAPIGSATCDIRPGDYVHTHNLRSDYLPTYARGAGDAAE